MPIFSLGGAYVSQFEGGQQHLEPLMSPVVLVPLGNKWLIESRDTLETDLTPPPGGSGFKGSLEKEVDYFQLDYIASPYATITVGKFLTPFGIYNERLYPIWVRNLQSDPLIFPLGVGPSNAGTGAMVRGGFSLNSSVNLNYAAYYSTLITQSPVDSWRMAGGRAGIFLPGPRLEMGGSFQHLLQDDRSNSFGFHAEWQPAALPLTLRAEYARSSQGSGYWAESAYRLTQVPVHQDFWGRIQLVGRMQEYFIGANASEAILSENTRMFEFGLNYYFRDDIRFVSSFGRQFSPLVTNNVLAINRTIPPSVDSETGLLPGGVAPQSTSGGNMNVWTVGITYRFVLPLGHGEMN
ncbi:MAG TPA: hypothetical protein VJR23_13345 [Candidatus Acidoferrales bacterium]|nr:hypothetical protein [Candidatus Acidoferrales bacterium]